VSVEVLTGDCRETLKTLPDGSVNCCVTSPPYFGLRDYGHDGQIGLEQTPADFVEQLVSVFREVKRALRDDGTLWLNLGDSYAAQRGGTHQPAETLAGGKNGKTEQGANVNRDRHDGYNPTRFASRIGLKHKDLIGIPWRVAFALQADGWYLRQDIIWHKPNPMPESVTDRCTKAHEYIFLLSKSARYFYDSEAIQEPSTGLTGGKFGSGGKEVGRLRQDAGRDRPEDDGFRNKRSVWTVNTRPYKSAHFATFPPDLIRPCILAGCPAGGTVLDPFGGSGTTGQVAIEEGRKAILCELNPEYVKLIDRRIGEVTPSLWSCVSEAENEPLLFAAK
jgi:site-specific DNA-methyltransferase (adenine-specific)